MLFQVIVRDGWDDHSTTRSSGLLMIHVVQPYFDQFSQYWKTGVTFFDPKQIAAEPHVRLFLCRGRIPGSLWLVDDNFHLAFLFGNANSSVPVADVVKAPEAQFSDWCSAFHASIVSTVSNTPIIRFF
jgi:hypothetical protein